MNRFKQARALLMPNCREATRLQSDALERPLSPAQRFGLRVHLWLCVWCRRYGRQLRLLRHLAGHGDPGAGAAELPPEARARIKRVLETNKN